MKPKLGNNQKTLLILLGALLFVASFFVRDWNTSSEGHEIDWGEKIHELGAETAHTEFVRYTSKQALGTRHDIAHDFGEALFEEVGVDGASVCDKNFGFGCHHQLFLSAIAAQGTGALHELDVICIDAFGLEKQECQHGIGHGLAQYFGRSRLQEALGACATLAWQEPLLGCQEGVFMEYNFDEGTQTVIDEREFNPDNPYEPCDSLDDRFKHACYFSQAHWWNAASRLSYAEIADMCLSIDGYEYHDTCLKGLGLSAVWVNDFDPHTASQKCDEIAGERSQVICKAGVAWTMWYDNNPLYLEVCSDLSSSWRVLCEEETDIVGIFNIFGE